MKRGIENINKNTEKMFFYKTNPSGGISLIVLVITIIVVIILAAAVIISLQSNNPMKEARKARIKSDVANMQSIFTNTVGKIMVQNQDVVQIEKGLLYTTPTEQNKTKGEATYKIIGADGTVAIEGKIIFGTGEKIDTTTYYTGRQLPLYSSDTKWYVDEQGLILVKVDGMSYGEGEQIQESIETPEEPITPPIVPDEPKEPVYETAIVGEKVVGAVRQYIDINGNKAIIPIGFAIVPGKTDISNGLVISDVANDTKDTGNQFVWVPVDNMDTFVREDGYYNGSIRKMINNSSEPLNYKGTLANAIEVDEYNKMMSSVREYHGFYIGRYEISNNGAGKVQTKKNKAPWVSLKWANSMTDLTGGAVEKARSMYPDTELTKGNVVSTLVYGVCWDETVRFIKKNYLGIEKDSSEHGNYNTNSAIKTGSNEKYVLNNIYDMAGNVWEWTMEAYKDNERCCRGGACNFKGSVCPISYREGWIDITSTGGLVGARVQLYIK